jgi:uncharacterized protein YbcI
MDEPRGTIGQQIARAARAFEVRRTKHERKWVAVFMNEDTVVIALHGCLTAAEKALAQSPAGAARVQEFHRRLFSTVSAPLLRTIKGITGMDVRGATAEIEPTTGSVVQVFTTDTPGEEFLLAPRGPAGTRTTGHGRARRHDGGARHKANRATGCVIRG